MGLWIRTQDGKRLVNVDEVVVDGRKIKTFSQTHALGLVLGKYNSQENALRVLDDLFKKLKAADVKHLTFEMPQEQF